VPKNLNDAFNAAKASRKVQSKLIIWESGVSKSQFYRIIQGQESPSLETKTKISKSLNIDSETFNRLHAASKSEKETIKSDAHRPIWVIPALGLCALFISLIVFAISRPQNTADAQSRITVAVPEDRTEFIKDVTIPDGTAIPVNTEFVKTWRVRNVGNVVWKDRYLKRITPASDLLCSSPAMVPIPETAPGEIVDISVTFVTPHLPGSCRTDWKTADDRGNLYFPDMHGLFSIVTVTE